MNYSRTTADGDYEDCAPRADALVHSLRAFGYDLAMAIADLVDNSIFAGASNVWVSYAWNNSDPWVSILDDGRGMTEQSLVEAMRLGSKSPLEARDPQDLGRFGLGLKTASFSQCKIVTVFTKTTDGAESVRFWNLDYLQSSKEWKLGRSPAKNVWSLLKPLKNLKSGTLVLWQNLDRSIERDPATGHVAETSFLERFLYVKQYLEMVFHQYLENRKGKLNIYVGEALCEPWDPYLKSNDFTQELSSEKYEENRVSAIPYVLPHVSKRNELENVRGAGPKGWNAQQGFYVYRNKRMIVSGGYLDFDLKAEEHYKLARIRVDITNDMDHEWSIDVRKAVATPPDRLKGEMLRIARVTRQRASEVYRTRTGVARKKRADDKANNIWLRRQAGDKIIYKLNTENPVLKQILSEVNLEKKWVKKLFHVIETSVPHRLIIMDGRDNEDCHVDLPEQLIPPPDGLLDICRELYQQKIDQGRSHEEAVDIICSIEPFDSHPLYRAFLDKLIEGANNESTRRTDN
ncbi:MAG: ATP-binding protein [Dehalococcoidales bacterium]|nr:ATP-binding protein [Dehalococcoidales bacterium]